MSLQPDARFAEILMALGADASRTENTVAVAASEGPLRGSRFNLAWAPDAAMTLAAAAAFALGDTTINGLRTLRDKECDRLAATACELRKLGIHAEHTDDALRILAAEEPEPREAALDTYNDHRMAMALAVVGLRRPGVSIKNPACVSKTYPTFWADLAALYDSSLSPENRERILTP